MKSLEELQAIRETVGAAMKSGVRVVVGMASCGLAAGARPVFDALNEEVEKLGLAGKVSVKQTGCIGLCRLEPIVEVYVPGQPRVTYIKMDAEKAKRVAEEHLAGGKPVLEYTVADIANGSTDIMDTAFYKKQKRVALRNCGAINPEDIDEYISTKGYVALDKVLNGMKPEEVIELMKASGLRGRGGAGFPTGLKWQFAAANKADQKFVICNADEGDPGAFMDRSVLEGDPHAVLEAMTIAGYAIGATHGYIYVRAEYPVAVKRLNIAIEQARAYGLLGENIMGSGFSFDIDTRLGAGAFVCGEETALITSIEGNRGEPRNKPPFPAAKGLFQYPTIINNVETLANVAQIIVNGPEWFASMGTEGSKGTKVFALGGKAMNTGLVEIPMGTTLREILFDIGGGIPGGKKFKAAQTGGPSGGCIPEKHLDTPIDYESLKAIGSMMGSGGLIVMDEDNCMVDVARFFLEFTVDESCGKCTPCRIGTRRLLEMLNKITEGKATLEDIDKMEELCNYISKNALCALGQTAPNPVLATLKYFRSEYEAHVVDKTCPAGVCKKLVRYEIVADKCKGCTLCARNCPAGAITGTLKQPHVIDSAKCVKCGVCMQNCKFNAIIKK